MHTDTTARPATQSRLSFITNRLTSSLPRSRACVFQHAFVLAALLLAAPLSASAYTLVMRSGRRVEISDTFKVTPTSVIHEPAPGVRVSVRLEHVDIAETERANGEPAGSFLRRMTETAPAQAAPPPTARRAKVVTNRDLEAFRRERVRNEEEYERVRAERGLPSREEWRRQSDEQDRRFVELARRIEAEERAAEQERLANELLALRVQLGLAYAQQPNGPTVVYYPTDIFPAPPQTLFRRGFGRHGLFPGRHFGGHPFGPHFWPQPFFGLRPLARASFSFRFGTPPARGHFGGGRGHGRR